MGEDPQRPLHALEREEPAGIQLGHETGQPEIVAERPQPLDERAGGADGDPRLEDVLVAELRELFEPVLTLESTVSVWRLRSEQARAWLAR